VQWFYSLMSSRVTSEVGKFKSCQVPWRSDGLCPGESLSESESEAQALTPSLSQSLDVSTGALTPGPARARASLYPTCDS
jgi:hypothetical protein